MRFQLPEDCAGVSYAGVPLAVAKDGTVEAEAAAAASLAPHGVMPVLADASLPAATASTAR